MAQTTRWRSDQLRLKLTRKALQMLVGGKSYSRRDMFMDSSYKDAPLHNWPKWHTEILPRLVNAGILSMTDEGRRASVYRAVPNKIEPYLNDENKLSELIWPKSVLPTVEQLAMIFGGSPGETPETQKEQEPDSIIEMVVAQWLKTYPDKSVSGTEISKLAACKGKTPIQVGKYLRTFDGKEVNGYAIKYSMTPSNHGYWTLIRTSKTRLTSTGDEPEAAVAYKLTASPVVPEPPAAPATELSQSAVGADFQASMLQIMGQMVESMVAIRKDDLPTMLSILADNRKEIEAQMKAAVAPLEQGLQRFLDSGSGRGKDECSFCHRIMKDRNIFSSPDGEAAICFVCLDAAHKDLSRSKVA